MRQLVRDDDAKNIYDNSPIELGVWFRQQLWESLSLPNHAAPQLKPMKANIVEEILKINL
jgi:hypothetical protein